MIIFSHPEKPLIDHLREVASNCQTIISERKWLEKSPFSQKIIEDVAYLCGSFHDIGKATRYFQHYLISPKHDIIGPKNHALISALFVREVVKIYLDTTNLENFDKQMLTTFAFTATRRHHGGLVNLEDEVLLNKYSKELKEIVNAFEEIEAQEIINFFLVKLNLTYSFETFKQSILKQEYENAIFDFYDDEIKFGDYEEISLSQKIQYFYTHQILYSTLLLSDKTDVIVGKRQKSDHKFPLDGVINYRDLKKFNDVNPDDDEATIKLNEAKNRAFYESIENLKKVYDPNHHIYSVTLPTGLGKTLTSLGVALELRKLNIDLQRLIITIPFTSIIDQNYEVYKSVAQTDDSSVILKHHHQAEPAYKMGQEQLEPDVSQFLIETWQSEVIVTTFVQLLNSMFSDDKSLLMKLPNLANSIIILDEVQTINYDHWKLINQVFKHLGELLNCYFIMMSATQPLIFEPEKEIIEIVPNYKSYFNLFNRTKIINKSRTIISLVDFVGEVTTYAFDNPKKDILLILNTKSSCLKVFNKLLENIDSGKCNLYFMATSITPYERKRIISFLKNKPDSKQQIVVTTQLIEAGVDISVDAVFRVLAPIDAIIQASGRANRYNEKGYQCDVFLYEIAESKKGTSKVYGSDLILKTKNVLSEIYIIEESNYLSLIEAYFKEVKKQSDNKINENIEYIEKLAFLSLGEFSLIEERNSKSLFVQINEDAKNVWNEYCEIYSDEKLNIFQKRLTFDKIKAKFYDFVVNIPLQFGQKEISFDSEQIFGFHIVYLNQPSVFYPYSDTNLLLNTGYNDEKYIFE